MGFSVSCKELPILMKQLRQVDVALSKEAKKNIRRAERPAIQAMSQSAAAAGMMKASRAVKPANRFTGKSATLSIKVDAKIAPNARPLDRGSQGSGGRYDRHPVFGASHWTRAGWHWVDQPLRKFFDRGSVAAFDACEKEMDEALGAVVKFLGHG